MHLTIDGFRGNPARLASEELVRELLDRIPDAIGMTKISTPHVQRYVGEKPADWGVSGFVLIAESHITIHTFPVPMEIVSQPYKRVLICVVIFIIITSLP